VALDEFLSGETDADDFWAMAQSNLETGKLRLLFLADEIPAQLQRIVEFLNEQMDRTEVLAVEIKQYAGHGLQTLVPRVLGQTSAAQQTKKKTRGTRKWDEPSFFAELEERNSANGLMRRESHGGT